MTDIQTTFSTPGGGQHIEVLLGMIRRSKVGSDAFLSFFAVDIQRKKQILIAAQKAKVKLWWSFQGTFGGRRNHQKFALFSRMSDGDEHVVYQSSGNLTGSAAKKYQNTVVVADRHLFQAYLRRFTMMSEAALVGTTGSPETNWYLATTPPGPWGQPAHTVAGYVFRMNYTTGSSQDRSIKAYFYPKVRAQQPYGGDTIVQILDNVRGNKGTIWLRVSRFRSSRIAVANRLKKLSERGLTVYVFTRKRTSARDASVNFNMRRALGNQVHLVQRAQRNPWIHDKYLLVDAEYQDRAERSWRSLVWTGSPNLTGEALRQSWETLLKIDNRAVFEAFVANYRQLHPPAA